MARSDAFSNKMHAVHNECALITVGGTINTQLRNAINEKIIFSNDNKGDKLSLLFAIPEI